MGFPPPPSPPWGACDTRVAAVSGWHACGQALDRGEGWDWAQPAAWGVAAMTAAEQGPCLQPSPRGEETCSLAAMKP